MDAFWQMENYEGNIELFSMYIWKQDIKIEIKRGNSKRIWILNDKNFSPNEVILWINDEKRFLHDLKKSFTLKNLANQ